MAIAAIQRYLDQPVHNYGEGRLLFDRYSNDSVLKLVFNTGSSSYHHRRLLDALRILVNESEPIVQAPSTDSKAKPKPVVPSLSDFDVPSKVAMKDDFFNLPDQMQAVVRKKNMHYKRAQQLFIEIPYIDDQDKRLEMALTILDDYDDVQACWSAIDEYRETGKVLEEKTVSIEEEVNAVPDALIGKSISNLCSNISKDKKKLLDLPEGHKKAKVLLRYQTNQIKLDLFRKREVGNE